MLLISSPFHLNSQELKIGGYMQTWLLLADKLSEESTFSESSAATWGFRIRRARLSARSKLNNTFSLTSWVEFAGRDRNLLDFYLTAEISPAIVLSIGQFRPHGQMYDTGLLSSSALLLYERPSISSSLAGHMRYDSYRDIGLMMNGKTGPVRYAVHMNNGHGRYTSAGTMITRRNFGEGLYGARIDLQAITGLVIGGHYTVNYQKDITVEGSQATDIDRNSYSFRAALERFPLPDFFLQFEYGGGANKETAPHLTYEGWYATTGYHITPALAAVVRYDTYSENSIVNTLNEKNITLGLLYYVFENSREIVRLGLNYAYRDQDAAPDIRRQRNTVLLWIQIRSIP